MRTDFGRDLIDRRVPQILGLYLAAGWGALEFMDWLVGRYALTPALTDLGLALWASLIPSVLILAYFHGARGAQRWTRVERIAIPVNLVAAGALLAGLGAFTGGGGAARTIDAAGLDPRRIAVLYFEDESAGEELGHLASALTGALIDELAQVPGLDVLPRSSVKPYRETTVPLDSLTRALGMGTLVEGAVTGSEERPTVTVTLVDPASQSALESFTIEGEVAAWPDLRENLAREVARLLRQRLGSEIRLREWRAGATSGTALQAVERVDRLLREAEELAGVGDTAGAARDLARADSLLDRATFDDPHWVEPIVQRGWAARQRARLSSLAPGTFDQERMREGLARAEQVLARAPGDPGALELRGVVRFEMSTAPEVTEPGELRASAEADLQAAVAADPFRARAWAALSNLHRIGTRYEEARLDAERALEADPFLSDADVILFRLYESSLELKDIGEAVHWCEEGRRRFPADRNFHACALFLVALAAGPAPDVARGRALADTLVRSSPPQEREQIAIIAQTWVAAVLARAGRADSAAALVERSRAAAAGGLKPWIDYYAANVYLLLGRRERSLELIGAFLEAIPQRKTYVASDWMFQELWDDPRFQALVAPAPSAGR